MGSAALAWAGSSDCRSSRITIIINIITAAASSSRYCPAARQQVATIAVTVRAAVADLERALLSLSLQQDVCSFIGGCAWALQHFNLVAPWWPPVVRVAPVRHAVGPFDSCFRSLPWPRVHYYYSLGCQLMGHLLWLIAQFCDLLRSSLPLCWHWLALLTVSVLPRQPRLPVVSMTVPCYYN